MGRGIAPGIAGDSPRGNLKVDEVSTREAAARLRLRTRTAQNLPPTVDDAIVLRKVATLLGMGPAVMQRPADESLPEAA